MFDFLNMSDNYEQRKVKRAEETDLKGRDFIVDTCAVSDSEQPFETAVCHPGYNDNHWIIVELYNTKKEAEQGHDKWVQAMKDPPLEIKDVSSATIARLADIMRPDDELDWRISKKEPE